MTRQQLAHEAPELPAYVSRGNSTTAVCYQGSVVSIAARAFGLRLFSVAYETAREWALCQSIDAMLKVWTLDF